MFGIWPTGTPERGEAGADGRRASSVDTLRGLACLLLVLYHVVGSNAFNGLRLEGGALRQVNDALVCLRMPLFALLAGWSYGWRRDRSVSGLGFVRHQARRLLLPTLTVGTLFALLQALTPQANAVPRDWTRLHWEPVAHFWFLEALFWVMLVLHGLNRVGALARPNPALLCWGLAAALSLVWRGPRWLAIDGAVYLLPYATLGWTLSRPAVLASLRRGPVVLLLIAVTAVSLAVLGPPQPDPDRRHPAMLLAGTGACLLLMAWRPQVGALAWLGRHAYAVFLFHPFFSAAARIALAPIAGVPMPLLVGAGVLAGVGGPLLLERALGAHRATALLLLGRSAPGGEGRDTVWGATRPRASDLDDGAGSASAHDPAEGRRRLVGDR